jgi:enoyl-CoA hydratase
VLAETLWNHWFRANGAAFDASLAYEFYGFADDPDAAEGLASLVEKRDPRFPSSTG